MALNPDQKIEITHDILAREVYARIDADDKMRLKITQFMRDRYDYYLETEILLDKKDLAYVDPWLGEVELSSQQEAFITESREEVEAQKRRRRRRNLAIGSVLATATIIATLFGFSASQQAARAEQAAIVAQEEKEKAEKAAQKAEDAKAAADSAKIIAQQEKKNAEEAAQKAKVAEAAANSAKIIAQQEKKNAEESKNEAELQAIAADKARIDANYQEKAAVQARDLAENERAKAESEREKARQALEKLEIANTEILERLKGDADQLISEANSLIYEIQPEQALEKLRYAIPLQHRKSDIAKGLMELAFFYNEAGQHKLSIGLTDTILQLRPSEPARKLFLRAKVSNIPRSLINQSLQTWDETWYDTVVKRYYPELVPVKGGAFCYRKLGDCDTSNMVTLSDFQIARTETTTWQYSLFAKATKRPMKSIREGFSGDSPIVQVSWYDAITYGNWLSDQLEATPAYQLTSIPEDPNRLATQSIIWTEILNLKSNGFRLPTEVEWEYAARGGVSQDNFKYSGSDIATDVGWFYENSDKVYGAQRTHPVCLKQPNSLGLYDMSGNACEWCWEADNSSIIRGGYFNFRSRSTKINSRDDDNKSTDRSTVIGFRVARSGL